MKQIYYVFVLSVALISNTFPQSKIMPGPPGKWINPHTADSRSLTLNIPLDKFQILEKSNGFDPVLAYNFQHILDSMISSTHLRGVSAGIIMPEKGTWLGAAGISDPGGPDSITSDMLFCIASNTKTFMAALMLKLQEEGLLSLDDQINKWLPAFPNIDSTITIRQLLNHTSGINDIFNEAPAFADAVFANPNKYWTPEEMLSYVLKPNFAPGESWRYTNTGYILVGMIIKEATGSDKVAPVLRKYILDPLNLNSTFLAIEEELAGEVAHSWLYNENDKTWNCYTCNISTSLYSVAWTAGGIFSTSENMTRWLKALHSGEVLSQQSMDEMLSFVPTVPYGLGIFKETYLGEELFEHEGDFGGYISLATYFPKKGVCIAVLVNQLNDPYKPYEYNISRQLLDKIIGYYKSPYDKVYPFNVQVTPTFMKPDQDTVIVTTKINNPVNHTAKVSVKMHSLDGTYMDSLVLADDGIHNDKEAGDGLFGGYVYPLPEGNEYIIDLHTFDLNSAYHHVLKDVAAFTTIGPVGLSDTPYINSRYNEGNRRQYIKIILKNDGLNTIAENLNVTIATSDSRIEKITRYNLRIPDLAAGEIDTSSTNHIFDFAEGYNPDSTSGNPIKFEVTIYSNDFPFWKDSFEFEKDTVTAIESGQIAQVLAKFELFQNYPNPFNPKTNIEYRLTNADLVNLSIYNLLGQKVATLVNKKQLAGNYSVEWDAHGFASGVYYYKIEAGDFQQVKKMLLVK